MTEQRVMLIDSPGFSRDVVADLIRTLPDVALVTRDPDTVVVDDRRFADAVPFMRGGVPTIVLGSDDDAGFEARARQHGAVRWVLKETVGSVLPELLRVVPATRRRPRRRER
jgi:hypothetical protein